MFYVIKWKDAAKFNLNQIKLKSKLDYRHWGIIIYLSELSVNKNVVGLIKNIKKLINSGIDM